METEPVEGEPVEIHVPDGPINSYKEFFVHLGTITAGVLIALSLEGLMEWNHHRMLVREAKESIGRELADNRKDLDAVLANAGARKQSRANALQLADEILRTGKTTLHEVTLGVEKADLSSASWQTAERTGALAHMEYADVQHYSAIYAAQDLYTSLQRQSFDRLTAALSIFAEGADPTTAPRADIEVFRQQVLALRAGAVVEEQLGQRLAELCRETPKE